jgi:hypothetical protein
MQTEMTTPETEQPKPFKFSGRRVYLPQHNKTQSGIELEKLPHSGTIYARQADGSLRKVKD